VREELGKPLAEFDNVLLTEPLEYTSFARLIGRSSFVITDSGGIQEEAPSLNKPVLVARESTERGEGVSAGTLILVGTDPDVIESEGAKLLEDDAHYTKVSEARNPYGDGFAADRIVQSLEYLLTGSNPPVPFGHGFSRGEIAEATGIRVPKPPNELAHGVEDVLTDSHEPADRPSWPL
jgi:UDP-N-acetylglucosamine 2-epimerase (non-hydrolysing)